MSTYYDTITTNSYYDYQAIANQLMHYPASGNSLDVGCGTGLILETFAQRCSTGNIVGFDLTQAMLVIAQERLRRFPNIQLILDNVMHLLLQQTYDLAFFLWWYLVFQPGCQCRASACEPYR